jgi:hypothetical protein
MTWFIISPVLILQSAVKGQFSYTEEMTNQTILGYLVNCTLISLVSAAVKRLNFVRP